MTSRYRISDHGILLIFNDTERRWTPMECSCYQHYCCIECVDFKVKDDTAILKCGNDVIVLDLED